MNKTININLGGIFFHIDEIAYQKLKKYLEAIRKSLSDDPQGRDEIIKDIESRISELLSDKIVDERQVISESNIEDVIVVMGQPEDYNIDEELFTEQPHTRKSKNSKKLYRDTEDKFLGGVAAGTAHYIGIEPIWSRIIWLVLAFGTGFGFLIYALLWILLPSADSTAEKLEMEGEAVNISNIEKKIRDEVGMVSERIKDGSKELSRKISNSDYKGKAKSGLQEFLDSLGKIILVLLKVFVKFIGALIIFISAIVVFSLIVSAFTAGSFGVLGFGPGVFDLPFNTLHTYLPYWLILILGFFAIAIPFIVLFMLGLKILSNNTKSFSKVTKLTLLAIWIISILGLVFSGVDMLNRYKYNGYSATTEDLKISPADTLRVSMVGNKDYKDLKYSYRNRNRLKYITIGGAKKVFSSDVDLDIRKSDTNSAYIKIRKEARGPNSSTANENAGKLEYQFKLNEDKLVLNNYFLNGYSKSFIDQEVDVILYLPEGYHLFLDKSTRNSLYDVDNVQDIYDKSMVNHYYVMGENELDCLDCEGSKKIDIDTDNVNLKINEDGLNFKAKSEDGDVEIKIDGNGLTIK
ncbi:MAG: phage shock protein PspC (stress-responsive transcriptional regulator) [Saprospiraceae bacterium]|jgi:phage shock protein PspC (stress-responsive transcriptional regulator)